ncbi:MAG: two component transcriptional regulator [Clostridia bacterium]|nr:two component transcriptional regulator [Clostridia bacterium]
MPEVILIVDDDLRIRRMISDFLKSNGYSTLEAKDGQEALDVFYANNNKIEAILLDIMMPKKDGLEVLKEIRENSLMPVILLTAKSEEYDQLAGFKEGADDYIPKPFSPTLLLARLQAVLRRTSKVKGKIISVGKITVDDSKKSVICCEKPLELTPKEYDLLLYFIQNEDLLVTREQILNYVWNYDYSGDLRTVDTHIKQLRAKFGEDCRYIKTIHGFGYKFEVNENNV